MDFKFQEQTYYKLTNPETKVETIAYCYRNPDANNELGFGFNIADGGGWMPIWDLSKKTEINKLKLVIEQ